MIRSKFIENNSPVPDRDSYSGYYRDFRMSYECMVEVRKLEKERETLRACNEFHHEELSKALDAIAKIERLNTGEKYEGRIYDITRSFSKIY